jgi:hypothetical protein
VDVFEYVAVMVTVVLALGLSHLLTALASMLVHPERVRLYWVHSVWILSILALHLQAWLVLWTRRHQPEFPFSQVTMMLAAAALIFVTARVLVPEASSRNVVDLREHFFQIRRPFFAILSVFWLFPTLGTLIATGASYGDTTMLFRFGLMALSISGLLVRDARFHALLALGWFALLLSHLVVVGPHLAKSAA